MAWDAEVIRRRESGLGLGADPETTPVKRLVHANISMSAHALLKNEVTVLE